MCQRLILFNKNFFREHTSHGMDTMEFTRMLSPMNVMSFTNLLSKIHEDRNEFNFPKLFLINYVTISN